MEFYPAISNNRHRQQSPSTRLFTRHINNDRKKSIKRFLLNRDGRYCAYCGLFKREEWLTIDHIKPISLGGNPRDKANMQLLCFTCHKIKTKRDMLSKYSLYRELKNL